MEVMSTEQAKENTENFAKRLITLQQAKKEIDQDIKALKEEYKEEGVPVQIVTSVLNKIKADKKKTDSQKFEFELITEWLSSNKEIDDGLGQLSAK